MATRISKVLLLILASLALSCKGFTLGGWMTPYKAESSQYQAAVTQLTKLKGLGLTRLYVDAYANGFMHATSATWQRDLPQATQGDHIANVIKAAEAVGGIEVVAWLEYGLRASSDYSLGMLGNFARSKGWTTDTSKSAGYYWLNPDKADFRAWYTQIVKEINDNYKSHACFKGVQLDDNFHVPKGFPGTTGINTLVQQISQAVGSNYLSLAPAPMPMARDQQNANWPAWMNAGYAYEVIPQTYTADATQFHTKLAQQLQYYNNKAKMGAGIRCMGSSAPRGTPVQSIRDQIAYAKAQNIRSAVVWTEFCYGYYH